MNRIVPYNEKIETSDGCFVKPNGEVVFTYGKHEKFSRNYCFGKDYDYLYSLSQAFSQGESKDFKELYNFSGSQEDIDVFASSSLTKEQLSLFMLWLEKYEFSGSLCLDFMVSVLGFDKIQTIKKRAITTTKPIPHLRYWNYYLMDWRIDFQPAKRYNEESGSFEYVNENWLMKHSEDRQVKHEIDEIKQNVLKRERHLFFR